MWLFATPGVIGAGSLARLVEGEAQLRRAVTRPATTDASVRPNLVLIVFAPSDEMSYSTIDAKPKRRMAPPAGQGKVGASQTPLP